MPAIVTVTTMDGRCFEKRVDHQKGDPRNPFSEEDFIDKFRGCTQDILSPGTQQTVIDIVMDLDNCDSVDPLVGALVAQKREV
jgi:2-methylcitrate dehydratase PrpD